MSKPMTPAPRDDRRPPPAERAEAAAFEPIARRLAAASAVIEAPAALIDRIEARLATSRRRQWQWRTSLALAAGLGLAVAPWWILMRGGAPPGPGDRSPDSAPAVVRVVFDPDGPFIAQPVETQSPNVSIVLVYHRARAAEPADGSANEVPSTQGSES